MNNNLLMRDDVWKMLGISEATLQGLIRKKKIPYIKIGRQIRFTKGMILKYLQDTRVDKKKGGGI